MTQPFKPLQEKASQAWRTLLDWMLMLAFAQSPQPRLADAVPVSVLRSPPHAEALLGAGKTEQRTLLAGSTCALAVAAQCRARVAGLQG